MSFKDKLLQLYKKYDLNPTSLSRKLGYDKSEKISRLTRDENNLPSFEIIRDLVKAFPGIDPYWWFSDEGDPVVEDPRTHYGFCKECIKKEGIIEFLRNECTVKDKVILELRRKSGENMSGAEGQDESTKKAS